MWWILQEIHFMCHYVHLRTGAIVSCSNGIMSLGVLTKWCFPHLLVCQATAFFCWVFLVYIQPCEAAVCVSAPVCLHTFLLRLFFASVGYCLFSVINNFIPFVKFSCFLSTFLSIYQSAGCWEANLSSYVKNYMIKFANITV